ncbi:right-handed parallel beta-helix repeat-containing protein [Polyangium mundeleinium]|uniref:Right-handed parallel beta-helix repeat-containing protein n=1 Tax=Polyangium mundeleinium TaxID=2995306 RepID=A0ABT5F1H9_9BACT|nr:right-handed parallel beta-helix repeat-containing protein [Polyangium mundeleinium]MDC0747915.1 right-handed parallel beta-helix repeat-containing protein [Polyangium mundeleinium]
MTFDHPFLRALFLFQLTLAAACGSSSSHGNSGATDGAGGTGGSGGAGAGMPAGSGVGGGGGAGGGNADPCAKPWPDATNTGIPAGTPSLTVIENDLHTEMDGQVFDAVELRGRLYVDHKNITIKRSLLVGDEYYVVYATDTASGLTIEDCEIYGGILSPDNTTVRRSHTHAGPGMTRNDGYQFAASHVLLEDNLFDGLAPTPGAHVDGIQDMGGVDVVIRHNWIDPAAPPVENGGVNAAVFVSPEFGNPSSDVTVECNMLLGGGSWYPLRIYGTTGSVVVRGNRFDRNFMGVPVHLVDTTLTTWEDNAFSDNGEGIPAP